MDNVESVAQRRKKEWLGGAALGRGHVAPTASRVKGSAAVAFWLEHVVEPCRQRRKGRSGRGHGAGIDGSVPRV